MPPPLGAAQTGLWHCRNTHACRVAADVLCLWSTAQGGAGIRPALATECHARHAVRGSRFHIKVPALCPQNQPCDRHDWVRPVHQWNLSLAEMNSSVFLLTVLCSPPPRCSEMRSSMLWSRYCAPFRIRARLPWCCLRRTRCLWITVPVTFTIRWPKRWASRDCLIHFWWGARNLKYFLV